MPESLAEQLSRFTPDKDGLDRDALLFAAGRASARRNYSWPVLAGLLTASQMLTLALLWPRPNIAVDSHLPVTVVSKGVEVPTPQPISDASEPYPANRLLFSAANYELPPTTSEDLLVEANPPVYAFIGKLPEWVR